MKVINGEEYLTIDEVLRLWPASRNLFYKRIKPRLRTYHFEGKATPRFYKKAEVLALRDGRLEQRDPILISGLLGDWTVFLRSLGYQAETKTISVEITDLPEEVARTFRLHSDQRFVRRTRMTLANGIPICFWSTYYPVELVGEILAEIQRDPSLDVIKRIRELRSLSPAWERDRYLARNASPEEQALLQLVTNEPVLVVQRGCWTSKDKQTLTHISHMVLVASWFSVEHEFPLRWGQEGAE
ncbi:UTRA domain-containing protein [Thermogemmatispora sp.]|uniref:UTRA domain-containing protein n=1 Tax=Thermogemmatispora sp. TaxID=1968838 RepID=UPI0035E4117A